MWSIGDASSASTPPLRPGRGWHQSDPERMTRLSRYPPPGATALSETQEQLRVVSQRLRSSKAAVEFLCRGACTSRTAFLGSRISLQRGRATCERGGPVTRVEIRHRLQGVAKSLSPPRWALPTVRNSDTDPAFRTASRCPSGFPSQGRAKVGSSYEPSFAAAVSAGRSWPNSGFGPLLATRHWPSGPTGLPRS
jgi:hypothetical protein